MIKLLWADDDCDGTLRPLKAFLVAGQRFALSTATNYRQALTLLTNARQSQVPVRSLLVDIVLPESEGGAALSPDLGLRLAREAVELGVLAIVVLTVVPLSEIQREFNAIAAGVHGHVAVAFFSKTELLEGSNLDDLLEQLARGRASEGT